MSPERVRKENYDFSSDIWSLGLVVLECATGMYPYPKQETCIDMIQTLVDMPPPAPSPEYFSPECCSFIECCLRKKVRIVRFSPVDIILLATRQITC